MFFVVLLDIELGIVNDDEFAYYVDYSLICSFLTLYLHVLYVLLLQIDTEHPLYVEIQFLSFTFLLFGYLLGSCLQF